MEAGTSRDNVATAELTRRSGVALWRQIADRIRSEAAERGDGRLAPEQELALRFGVNRHTVRAAIASLVREGVLRSEQGRGTFIVGRRRLTYPIARRTSFSTGLEGQAQERFGYLLRSRSEPADEEVARALAIAPGTMVSRLETLSEADSVPVSRATVWFDAARFAGIASAFQRSGSITTALAGYGVTDYERRSTTVSAQHASEGDIADLRLSPGAIVLATRYVNVDAHGDPVQYAITRFAADRVELQVDHATG